jgi:hypothetical protein
MPYGTSRRFCRHLGQRIHVFVPQRAPERTMRRGLGATADVAALLRGGVGRELCDNVIKTAP